MNTEIKMVESTEVPAYSCRVISSHATHAAAAKKAARNVSGTFIIHEAATARTNERFLVALPSL